MRPGRFAIPVQEGMYYDSLRHQVCSETELASRDLVAGQESKAIERRLFEPGPFQLLLIPSFECNLRCPQCYVAHLLERPSGSSLGNTDPDKLISFVERAAEYTGPLKSLTLVGGEPFLHCDAFRRYLDAGFPVSATTNGVFEFEDVKDILGRMLQVTFSIDGWPEQHNRTRKSLQAGLDPFTVTYRNLCQTITAFPDLTVLAQGAIIDDDAIQPLMFLRYFGLMLGAGVKRGNISLGPCAATPNRGPINAYINFSKTSTRRSPCCDYQMHKGLVIYNNHIYGSYHRLEELPPLAHLDDPVELTLSRRRESIRTSMLMLHDEVCMNECSAVGVCWGLCSADRHIFESQKPSSVCNRSYKEGEVSRMAQQATTPTLPALSACERLPT